MSERFYGRAEKGFKLFRLIAFAAILVTLAVGCVQVLPTPVPTATPTPVPTPTPIPTPDFDSEIADTMRQFMTCVVQNPDFVEEIYVDDPDGEAFLDFINDYGEDLLEEFDNMSDSFIADLMLEMMAADYPDGSEEDLLAMMRIGLLTSGCPRETH